MIHPGLLLQKRYRVLKSLGQGGFGLIFEVDDGGRRKVLKVLNLDNCSDPERQEKLISLFKREAEVLHKLHHPGIPRTETNGYFTFHPKGRLEPFHCLVMEKINGQNLQEWMRSRSDRPISQEQAIAWLKQLVEILDKLHQKQYFHRDIKPSNIMLKPDGNLVLIDFGTVREIDGTYLAKLVEDREVTAILSIGYTPPEQLKGKSLPQSDFYALGRTFVYLLTGEEPHNLPETQITEELIWRDRVPQISPLLADLIDDLMARLPGDRPTNTQAIAQRLAEINPAARSPESGWKRFIKNWPINRIYWQNKVKFRMAWLLPIGLVSWQFFLPWMATFYNDRGVENYLKKRLSQAIDGFDLALKLNPKNASALYNKGWSCETVRDFKCAFDYYQKAAQRGSAAAYSNLARLSITEKNDYAAALSFVRQGLELVKDDNQPVKYSLLKNQGWARLLQGDNQKAQETLLGAIALDGDRASAHCLLAQVMEAQGERQGSLIEWKTCRQYGNVGNPGEEEWLDMASKRLASRF